MRKSRTPAVRKFKINSEHRYSSVKSKVKKLHSHFKQAKENLNRTAEIEYLGSHFLYKKRLKEDLKKHVKNSI